MVREAEGRCAIMEILALAKQKPLKFIVRMIRTKAKLASTNKCLYNKG